MATVVFARGLQRYTDGAERVEVDGNTVRELIAALERRFPGLGTEIEAAGMAVALDGEILPDPLLEPVGPASEVHFLPPIGGG